MTANAASSSPLTAGKPVGAVVAALRILRRLGEPDAPLRLADVTRSLALNASTALNILRTLETEGLVSFDRASKRYALAHGLEALAAPLAAGRHSADLERRLEGAMSAAAHDLGATIAFWRRVGDEVELVRVAQSPSPMHIAFIVGRRLPMFLGAMGRLIAARSGLDETALEAHFARVQWRDPPDYALWRREVTQAAADGWALDRGGVNPGVLGVAVPVEPHGPVRHLISLVSFEMADDVAPLVERLRHVAASFQDDARGG